MKDLLALVLAPIVRHATPLWLRQYPTQHLRSDVVAGIVTAVLVLPQSLAYALLAGLPAQAGLLASILPVLVYAWFGSSRTQAVGPVAVTAIVTYAVLTPLAVAGSAAYLSMAASLALCSGIVVFLLGVLRLGFLSNLLSRPVVSGFISGSAVLIVISQLRLLIGVTASGSDAWQQLLSTLAHVPQMNTATAILGAVCLAVLLLAKLLGAALQRLGLSTTQADLAVRLMPLLVIALATVAVVLLDLDQQRNVAIVGGVQSLVGNLHFFLPSVADIKLLWVPALIVAFIGTVQNIAMAQSLAAKRHERIDPNQELRGLGLANITAAFYSGMPVGGGVSRTAVNLAAGAQTPLSGVVAALTMLLIVLVGTQGFARMPLAALAACIMVAALRMVDVAAFRRAWSYDRADALALLGTAGGVLVFDVQWGIALGIGFSLVSLLYRASAPHIAVMGRIVGSEHFRNVERHGVETLANAVFLRVDESLFFGNLRAVESRIATELAHAPDARHVVLVMSAVNRIDVTALEALTEMQGDLQQRHIALHLAEVKGPVQDRMASTPFWRTLVAQNLIHLSANHAFEAIKATALAKPVV